MDEKILALIIGIIIIILAVYADQWRNISTKSRSKLPQYSYSRKNSLVLTRTEKEIFNKINIAVSDEYFVFPKVGLALLFDYKIKGKTKKGAFDEAGKNFVDYVLCDKESLEFVCALEIQTHLRNLTSRTKQSQALRDIFVEANLPLIIFKSGKSLDSKNINLKIAEAIYRQK